VVTVGTNRLGGNVVKVLGPGLEWHYYAHLDRYGAFRRGDVVRPGDVLGYVGDSGDARGTPTHLHYAIYSSSGHARNPYPRLAP
jgi:peptidoglycan LD-endopeptidase LytH